VTFDAASASAGGQVQYTLGEAARHTSLAYATTVHKAQGNEWPAVICALHGSHWAMLSRGVLYTALSRAQTAAYVVGTRQAMGIAAKNVSPNERHTLLKLKLQGLLPSSSEAFASHLGEGRTPPRHHLHPSGGPSMTSHEIVLQSDLAWALYCAGEGGDVQDAGGVSAPSARHSDIWTQQNLARDQAWRDLNICSAIASEFEDDPPPLASDEDSTPPSTDDEPPLTALEASSVLAALKGRRGDTWWDLGLEGALQVGTTLHALLPPSTDQAER